MKINLGARGSGKTTELIKQSSAEWLYIACKDIKTVAIVANRARELNLDIPFPLLLTQNF